MKRGNSSAEQSAHGGGTALLDRPAVLPFVSKGGQGEVQRRRCTVQSIADVLWALPFAGNALDGLDVLEEDGHAQHADAASRFVGQWVEVSPIALAPSLLHVGEVSGHLFLERIQDAADHGIVALEHLLEVIEVVVH